MTVTSADNSDSFRRRNTLFHNHLLRLRCDVWKEYESMHMGQWDHQEIVFEHSDERNNGDIVTFKMTCKGFMDLSSIEDVQQIIDDKRASAREKQNAYNREYYHRKKARRQAELIPVVLQVYRDDLKAARANGTKAASIYEIAAEAKCEPQEAWDILISEGY